MSVLADTFHEFLLAHATTTPDAVAVLDVSDRTEDRDGDGAFDSVTYGELAARAAAYAEVLEPLGLDVGDRVVVESDTSASAIAAIAACSSLGLAFIPVSPETPARRLAAIMDSVGAALHLQAGHGRRDGLDGTVGLGRFGPAGLTVERVPAPRPRARRHVVTTDTAYMIFTSGTTGRPKGVVMSHRGVLSFYRGMLRRDIVGPGDVVATTSPLQFDFALLDIGLTLGSGATLVPVPRSMMYLPRRFLALLRDVRATQVNGVPSVWRGVLRHERAALSELDHVRGILFSGEAFPLPELRAMRGALPGLRVVNCFGPTEAMAFSLTDVPDPLPDGARALPMGHTYAGAEITLIDEDGRPVDEPGTIGEVHFRGPSLFTGYWDDPEASARALVPDPLDPRSGQRVLRSGDLAYRGDDGELYFHGRVDSQVKIRGNRVELGEIERRLSQFPGIRAAVAIVVPRAEDPATGADPVLTAFVVPAPGVSDVNTLELSSFCMAELPGYMVPRAVHVLDELPVTPNGKTDRARLAALVDQPA